MAIGYGRSQYVYWRSLQSLFSRASCSGLSCGEKRTDKHEDYDWRPDALEQFPYYFFIAGTDVVTSVKDGVFSWHQERDLATGKLLGRHPCFDIRARDARYWSAVAGSARRIHRQDPRGSEPPYGMNMGIL